MPLDKQIQILSIDTGNFYSNKEARLHWKNHTLKTERNRLVNGGTIISANGKTKRIIVGLKNIESKISEYGVTVLELEEAAKDETGCGFVKFGENQEELFELYDNYSFIKNLISMKNKAIKKTKDDLLKLLENKINANVQSNGSHHTRTLRENQVSEKMLFLYSTLPSLE